MPINEVLINSGVSAETNSIEIVSDIVIGGEAAGLVFLQVQLPISGEWIDITNQSGSYSIMSPDTILQYRFRASAIKSPVEVYFGP